MPATPRFGNLPKRDFVHLLSTAMHASSLTTEAISMPDTSMVGRQSFEIIINNYAPANLSLTHKKTCSAVFLALYKVQAPH